MLSIITPTYNRSILLKRLYESLVMQTSKDFEWIIIDDGSIDDTREIVDCWIKQNKINIRYIYQENQGKYIAHNTGVKNANGDLCLCIDSDDYPTLNCVELILNHWKINNKEMHSGIIALKSYSNNTIIGDRIPINVKETTLFDLSERNKISGDKTLVYRTSILKQNLFPEFKETKFVPECVVYDKIDRKYKLLVLNENICICEYQVEGYSNNFESIMLNNPIGFNIYYMQRIDMALNIYKRIIYSAKYHAFKWMTGKSRYKYKGRYNFLVNISVPLGYIYYIYYKLKKRKLSI